MKTNRYQEKPDDKKLSRTDLFGVIEFLSEDNAEMGTKYYDMCRKIELYEIEIKGLFKYVDKYQDKVISRLLTGELSDRDINQLIQLQKTVLKEIRTWRTMERPRDNDPMHELVNEYYRRRAEMNN